MTDWRILVVEDDRHGQRITRSLLEHYHIAVDVAGNAEEALHFLESTRYNAAIIDLSLPGMSGWELLEVMHEGGVNIPSVAMTAYHSPTVAQQAREAGFAAYFSKPIDVEHFVEQLSELLV